MSELETKTDIEDLTAEVSDEALEALAAYPHVQPTHVSCGCGENPRR